MSDEEKITGGCLCGAVRYEVTQSPDDDIGYCHCRMCQKALGGLSSEWAERGFCPECGTPLVMRDSESIGVLVGSLDHPEDFPPTSHSGIESQVPWLKIADGLPRWKTEDDPYFVAATQAADKDGK